MIRVRDYVPSDSDVLGDIFDRAVRIGAAGAYCEGQRAAWADARASPPGWLDRLGGQITVVAERDGVTVGFMTLGHDGHLDLAFVTPEAMGGGIAAALHDRVLAEAASRGMTLLTTDASHLARRFFLKQGWIEIAEQRVRLGSETLTNFRMHKRVRRWREDPV